MGLAFDFSKVKKAGKAKSLNDLYAGGIPGNTNPDQQYGDNIGETKVKGTVEKFKNNNTKKRVLRQYYGRDESNLEDESEIKDIERLASFESPMTEYADDYWNDFSNRVDQSQPASLPNGLTKEYLVDMFKETAKNDPNYAKRLDTDVNYIDYNPIVGNQREYGEQYDTHHGFTAFTGKYPSTYDYLNGIGGQVKLPNFPNLKMRVHSHPLQRNESVESEKENLEYDRDNRHAPNEFMLSGLKNIIKYGKDPNNDIVKRLNQLYYNGK